MEHSTGRRWLWAMTDRARISSILAVVGAHFRQGDTALARLAPAAPQLFPAFPLSKLAHVGRRFPDAVFGVCFSRWLRIKVACKRLLGMSQFQSGLQEKCLIWHHEERHAQRLGAVRPNQLGYFVARNYYASWPQHLKQTDVCSIKALASQMPTDPVASRRVRPC